MDDVADGHNGEFPSFTLYGLGRSTEITDRVSYCTMQYLHL